MKTNFSKTKKLSRSELKEVSGGIALIPPCSILCGPAGGVISTRPGIGDACNADRSICCICY
ncbi:hypothetical protein [Chryseobacterium sediminis]|uniref:hypothetical protein n=1 Tax=Chryseobacterium sediminis TaxID=1679494 RepID=UPI0028564F7D|nr:hypothetical protein [Chryseobacterium sediminis]MDR6465192.1 hypothetical protein [Chryseobacterium sediminis]